MARPHVGAVDRAGLEVLVRQLRDGVVIVDADGRILLTNRRGLAGGTEGKRITDLADALRMFTPHGQLYEPTQWPVMRSLRHGEVVADEEYLRIDADGHHRSFKCRSAPVYMAGGAIAGAVVVERELTQQTESPATFPDWVTTSIHDAYLEDAAIVTDTEGVVRAWNLLAEQMFGWSEPETIGRPSREVAGSALSESEVADARRELAASGRRRIEEARHRRDGSELITDTLTVALHDDQREPAGFLTLLRDVTLRRRSARELERGINQQAAVAQLGLKALRDRSVLALMYEAAPLVCRTLGVEYAEIAELTGTGEELVAVATAGFGDAPLPSMPTGRGSPSGFVLVTGEPVLVEDLSAETRFSVPDALRARGVLSLIAAVIDPAGTPFGTVAAMSTYRRRFSESDISFVQSIANVLATAIGRAEAAEKLDTARDAERSRIARDLHDDALRELTDAHALAAMARPTAPTSDDERRWTALSAALQRASRQLRAAIYDLTLSNTETHPFGELLEGVIATQSDTALDRHVELVGGDALPAMSLGRTGTELLRIVREAITNARLHSGATVIRVDASASTADSIHLDVNDDGAWPDREVAVRSRRGTGIAAMFARADALGAELRIEVRPDGGTRVSVHLAVEGEVREGRG